MSKAKKRLSLETVIRRAVERECVRMQMDRLYPKEKRLPHIDSGWTGAALASWLSPGIIRSVKAALARKP